MLFRGLLSFILFSIIHTSGVVNGNNVNANNSYAATSIPLSTSSTCSLFDTDDSTASPATVFVGGFGGSSSRLIATLLDAAGVYMTDRSINSEDTNAARVDKCNLNNPVDIILRMKRRRVNLNFDEAVLSPLKQGEEWSIQESSILSCLAAAFDDDIIANTRAPRCEWGFKEPRLMYYAPMLHFGLGVKFYLHIVRDVRTMHHLHIEHDPMLWRNILGPVGFARAIDEGFRRVASAGLGYPNVGVCQGNMSSTNQKQTCGDAIAAVKPYTEKNPCGNNQNKCKEIKDKISHRVAFVIGWSKWHSLLVAHCRSDLIDPLAVSSSPSLTRNRRRVSDQKKSERRIGHITPTEENMKSESSESRSKTSQEESTTHRNLFMSAREKRQESEKVIPITVQFDDMEEVEEGNQQKVPEESSLIAVQLPKAASSNSDQLSNKKSPQSKATSSSLSNQNRPSPWIQIMRVETLWDRSTCEQSFELLLENLQLPPRTSAQREKWQKICSNDFDSRDKEYVYSKMVPNAPFVPAHPSLTIAMVTAMALPGLRALKYVVGKESGSVEGLYEDVFGENWEEIGGEWDGKRRRQRKLEADNTVISKATSFETKASIESESGRFDKADSWCKGIDLRRSDDSVSIGSSTIVTSTTAEIDLHSSRVKNTIPLTMTGDALSIASQLQDAIIKDKKNIYHVDKEKYYLEEYGKEKSFEQKEEGKRKRGKKEKRNKTVNFKNFKVSLSDDGNDEKDDDKLDTRNEENDVKAKHTNWFDVLARSVALAVMLLFAYELTCGYQYYKQYGEPSSDDDSSTCQNKCAGSSNSGSGDEITNASSHLQLICHPFLMHLRITQEFLSEQVITPLCECFTYLFEKCKCGVRAMYAVVDKFFELDSLQDNSLARTSL